MKSKEIAEMGIEALKSGKYHQVRLNFPNGACTERCLREAPCLQHRLPL